jgi:tetratricopeptide (TPR) repeat protein
MARFCGAFLLLLITPASLLLAEERHHLSDPENLGKVSFANSCVPAVQAQFERGIALLHSFAYADATGEFHRVAEKDPRCAMAYWGIAMTHFHELWEPPIYPSEFPLGQQEIQRAQQLGGGTERERSFINALALVYQEPDIAYRPRALNYEHAMEEVAVANKKDVESQVFYSLALLAVAVISPSDRTHQYQKQAAGILEPLFRRYPQHPGIAHYLIHAYDNAELAPRGLEAARAYSRIAPSAPHALHMPSHIFTRLGLWEDSIRSNLAAREAARAQGDIGEELHAMDYLVYAYLQAGREKEVAGIIQQLNAMSNLDYTNFKVGYAAAAMPVRFVVERSQWAEAAIVVPHEGTSPQVVAIAVWAKAVGLAKTGHPTEARAQIEKLRLLGQSLRDSKADYWATQVNIQLGEAGAWAAQAEGKSDEAVVLMRSAADQEDAVEKLPVTPGAIIPAREQLGDLLLEQNWPKQALEEFEAALKETPRRRGALAGAARAAELTGNRKKAARFQNEMHSESLR